MAITYTPATNFGAKDSLPVNDPSKVIKGSEFTTEFTAIQTAFGLAAPAASPTFTGTVTISSVDINGGTIDGVTIGGSSAGAGSFTTLTASGDVNFDSGTLFVDASADAVGIGTSSPQATYKLTISGTDTTYPSVYLENTTNSKAYSIRATGTSWILRDVTAGADRLTLDTSGNLGIGTGSPDTKLHLSDGGTPELRLESTDTSVIAGQSLGDITWEANDVSAGGAGVRAKISALAENAGTIYGLAFYTGTGAAPTEKVRITNTGNVGIGTTSPSGKLSVNLDGSTELVTLRSSSGRQLWAHEPGGNARPLTIKAQTLTYADDTSTRLIIDSSGNLLVGTTSSLSGASHSFLATGTTASYYAGIFQQNGTGSSGRVQGWQLPNTNSVASYFVYATNSGGNCLNIFGNGDITNSNNSYGAISDVKVKENITDATPKLDKLNQVRVVNYNLVGDEKKQIGVIAQDLEQIFPGMVSESPDRDADGNDLGTTTKSVKYSVFVPMLIKAMQEQQEQINELKAEVAALKGA